VGYEKRPRAVVVECQDTISPGIAYPLGTSNEGWIMRSNPLCLLLLIGISRCVVAEPGSCRAQPPAAGPTDARLEPILHGIRAGERLCKNLAFEYVRDYRLVLPRSKWAAEVEYILTQRDEVLLVLQENKYYQATVVKGQAVNGTPVEKSEHLGHDGEVYRFKRQLGSPQEGHANIWTGGGIGRQAGTLDPQRMGYPMTHFRLSEILDGSHLQERKVEGVTQEVQLLPGEVVGGIPCVKLNLITKVRGEGGKVLTGKQLLWLARDRHYLPVKSHVYGSIYEIDHPLFTVATGDWREVESGIVIPFQAEKKSYDAESLVKGEVVLSNTDTITVTQVSLRPKYDIALFRNVHFPPGMTVYTVPTMLPILAP
jgi:hypothetical protein